MGETVRDRASMLATLANLPQHPESVPINQLVRVPGTPLAGQKEVDPFDFVRTIAVARIVMPKAAVRLSAGREVMSDELQALCFLAGANSIFYGEKLLTTGNPDVARDRALVRAAGYLSRWRRRSSDNAADTTRTRARTGLRARAIAGQADCRMQRDAATLKAALADLEQRQLKRTRRVGIEPGLVNFCSNDYLGLKDHPEVVRAFTAAAAKSWRGQRRLASGDRPWARTRGAGSRTCALHGPRKGAGFLHRLHGQHGRNWRAGGSKQRNRLGQAQSCVIDRRLPAFRRRAPTLSARRWRACGASCSRRSAPRRNCWSPTACSAWMATSLPCPSSLAPRATREPGSSSMTRTDSA